ncbi:MAG: hypothetical protein ACP5OO_07635 [Chloroflexia bacterium]
MKAVEREALLEEARRRKKLYPTTRALWLAGLWFPGPEPVRALRKALDEVLAFLPLALLSHLVAHTAGHVIVVPHVPAGLRPRRSCYVEGEVYVEGRTFRNPVFLLGADLAGGWGVGPHEVAHLLDHLLGSDGRPEGAYLSEGGGVTPFLRELGGELHRLYLNRPPGGYRDGIGPRGYLARSVQAYVVRPEEIRSKDPAMYAFLDEVLLAESFWKDKEGCLGHSGG